MQAEVDCKATGRTTVELGGRVTGTGDVHDGGSALKRRGAAMTLLSRPSLKSRHES